MNIMRDMCKGIASEIGSKTREFYEFVLPPIDMSMDGDNLILLADMPGFEKEDIRVSLRSRTLRIQACKKMDRNADKDDAKQDDEHHADEQKIIVYAQRPNIIDKEVKLPALPKFRSRNKADDEATKDVQPTAKYEAGVLKVTIPIRKTGLDIEVK